MCDLISRSGQNVYLKVHMPYAVFEALVRQTSSEPKALREIRLAWERSLHVLTDESRRQRVL
jgi:hypothetical protein